MSSTIAEMRMDVESARAYVYRAAAMIDKVRACFPLRLVKVI